jgi:hypothetical protein
MDNVIVYVGSGFNPTEFQKIMDTLRKRNIITTTDRSCATLVLLPNDSMDVDTLLQEHLPIQTNIFRIPQHVEVIIPTPERKPTKRIPIPGNVTTRLYNNGQSYKQRFLTRTKCK